MRKFFTLTLCALLLMSIVAWRIGPKPLGDGRIPLLWVTDDNPARSEQVALFNNMNRRYHLKIDPANGGTEKVIVQSIAKVGPDMFDSSGQGQLSDYVKADIAWDITQELEKAGIDVNKAVWSLARPSVVYEGRVYGFPANVVTNGIWFNKDIFDEHGIKYPKGPWTWKELLTVAQRLTERDKNGRVKRYGLLCSWYWWRQFIIQWGGRTYTADGTRCIIDSPEAIAAAQFMHDLIYKYRVMPSPAEEATMATQGGWGSDSIAAFSAGKGAMALGGRWWLSSLRKHSGLRLGAVECPHGRYRVFLGAARVTLINKHSPRRYQALEFLKYAAGKEYNELVNQQADALAPVIQYSYGSAYTHNSAYPAEDFHAVWRDAAKYTVPEQVSPFVMSQVATRILDRQMDLARTNQKTPAEALKAAAGEINAEIHKNLEKDPLLRAKYEALVRRGRQ
ncbi:MAG: extracellular solute-binding protein [Armatimonadota bacterium]